MYRERRNIDLCIESKAMRIFFLLQGLMVILILLISPLKILDFEQRYAATSSPPICPNTNVCEYRLHCVCVHYFNIHQLLTTHYVGQCYNCGINFKTKQNKVTISRMTSLETSYLVFITAVPFFKSYWSLNRTQI